jgi:Flp pilus assembly protein TadD
MKPGRLALFLAAVCALEGCADAPKSAGQRLTPPLAGANAPLAVPTEQNEALLYLNVVDGLVRQQRCGAALAFLDDYATKERSLSPRYWLLRGDALLGLGRGGEASISYAKLAGTPLAAEGWNGQGRVAAAGQQWRLAVENFQKAVGGRPSNPDFLNNLAFSELQTGQSKISALYLRQAHELDPASDLIRNNLIIALTLAGDSGGAEAILQDIKQGAERDQVRALVQNAVDSGNFNRKGKS